MPFTYQRRYIWRNAVSITFHADATGSFEGPLKAAFADGLVDLIDSVRAYLTCYAQAYFPGDLAVADAYAQAERCAKVRVSGVEAGMDGVTSPTPTGPARVQGTRRAAGTCLVGSTEYA